MMRATVLSLALAACTTQNPVLPDAGPDADPLAPDARADADPLAPDARADATPLAPDAQFGAPDAFPPFAWTGTYSIAWLMTATTCTAPPSPGFTCLDLDEALGRATWDVPGSAAEPCFPWSQVDASFTPSTVHTDGFINVDHFYPCDGVQTGPGTFRCSMVIEYACFTTFQLDFTKLP